MKKTLTGLFAGALMLGIGMLIGQFFQLIDPSLKVEYENPDLFRPWSDPLMSFYFVEPFVTGIIMAFIWAWCKGIIRGKSSTEKGIGFGFIYWLTGIPGMLMTYSSFPLSILLVSSWCITSLIQAICAGLLFSKMIK